MTIYRIAGWNDIFENHRTRELRCLEWVPVPNKQDGDGFTDLMSRDNGPAIYGAWILMLQLASKCDPRGTLQRGSGELPRRNAAGRRPAPRDDAGIRETPKQVPQTPHTAESISRITRCPISVVQEAIEVCTEIGWLECITIPDNDLRITANERGNSTEKEPRIPANERENSTIEGKGMEGNRIEGNGSTNTCVLANAEEPSKPTEREISKTLAKVVLAHFNEMTGSDFRPVDSNLTAIAIRLEQVELDVEGVNRMIDRQCALWKTNERMSKYLRIETLFKTQKFHDYYAMRSQPISPGTPDFSAKEGW